MSDDVNKLDDKAAAPAIAADSSELPEESLKEVTGGTDLPKEEISMPFTKIEYK